MGGNHGTTGMSSHYKNKDPTAAYKELVKDHTDVQGGKWAVAAAIGERYFVILYQYLSDVLFSFFLSAFEHCRATALRMYVCLRTLRYCSQDDDTRQSVLAACRQQYDTSTDFLPTTVQTRT